MPASDPQRLPVAAAVGRDRDRPSSALRNSVDERERMGLRVRVDADHEGDLICKHGTSSSDGGNVVPVVTTRAAARLR